MVDRNEKQSRVVKHALFNGKLMPRDRVLELELQRGGDAPSDAKDSAVPAASGTNGQEGAALAEPASASSLLVDLAEMSNNVLGLKKFARENGIEISDELTKGDEVRSAIENQLNAIAAEAEAAGNADNAFAVTE